MNLTDTINNDMILAMKQKENLKLSVLRMAKGAIQLEKINKKRDLTDEETIDIIVKQIKLRKDSIIEFEKANREDLVLQNQKEIDILAKYLPTQLTKEEIEAIIAETFQEVQPTSIKDLGKIMKSIMPKVKGKVDMNELNQLIKEKL